MVIKNLFIAVWLSSGFYACNNNTHKDAVSITTNHDSLSVFTMNDSIPTPAGFEKIFEVTGNLDSSAADEKIVLFNTERMVEMGRLRELRIYKINNNAWELWHRSVGAVLPSEHGGTLGDPFQEINIAKGSLLVSHLGGGREKWSYRHQYRFQENNWKLIGARVFFGSPCDTLQDFDYNLTSGNIHYKKFIENCQETGNAGDSILMSKTFVRKWNTLPDMDGFYPGNNEILIPESNLVFYY
jgi:hypothetical protein